MSSKEPLELEPLPRILARIDAARKWLESYAEKNRHAENKDQSPIAKALRVIVLTHTVSDFLAAHDPMALKQAQEALDGTSYLNYVNK